MTCKHLRGDWIQGVWVCCDCYEMLADGRPKTYRVGKHDGHPQEIAWQAEHVTEFAPFVGAMVGYLRRRSFWSISRYDALVECLDALSMMGERFGDPAYDWSASAGREIVREAIISYWDDEAAGANQ